MPKNIRLALFSPNPVGISETFIQAHIDNLPCEVIPHFGNELAITNAEGKPFWPWGFWFGAAARRLTPKLNHFAIRHLISRRLRYLKANAVLAEYGTTGSVFAPACKHLGIPLFVHFHGFDASVEEILMQYRERYRFMFEYASGIVVVSKAMKERLIELGADDSKIHLNPCGVDEAKFSGGTPQEMPPNFLAVGRFVDKKAPYLTVIAFNEVLNKVPEATLTMVGTGPLVGPTRRVAEALGIEKSVSFLGAQPPERIQSLLKNARAFVQHSLVADNGDSEGTPVAVIEAQMTGVPVIATRHAGIQDIVIEGETGFLVDEGDTSSMGQHMLDIAKDPSLAGQIGKLARIRATNHFTLDQHIERLTSMIAKSTYN